MSSSSSGWKITEQSSSDGTVAALGTREIALRAPASPTAEVRLALTEREGAGTSPPSSSLRDALLAMTFLRAGLLWIDTWRWSAATRGSSMR